MDLFWCFPLQMWTIPQQPINGCPTLVLSLCHPLLAELSTVDQQGWKISSPVPRCDQLIVTSCQCPATYEWPSVPGFWSTEVNFFVVVVLICRQMRTEISWTTVWKSTSVLQNPGSGDQVVVSAHLWVTSKLAQDRICRYFRSSDPTNSDWILGSRSFFQNGSGLDLTIHFSWIKPIPRYIVKSQCWDTFSELVLMYTHLS